MQYSKKIAAEIYDALQVEVARGPRGEIKLHESSTFLGYVDLDVIHRPTGTALLRLPNVAIKILPNAGFYLDVPSDVVEGAGKDGDDARFPKWRPRSAEMRAVMTLQVSQDKDVIARMEEAEKLRQAAEEGCAQGEDADEPKPSSNNPFLNGTV